MEGGIALYERALACNARHADALYNLGVACGETGRTQRAVFYYELAVHFNPACAEAWNNLGVLQRELGNFERARPPASPPVTWCSLAHQCMPCARAWRASLSAPCSLSRCGRTQRSAVRAQ